MNLSILRLGKTEFSYCYSTIRKVLPTMEKLGFNLFSLEDIARFKIFETRITKDCSYLFDIGPILTKDAILCFPGNPPTARVVKNSPLLEHKVTYTFNEGMIIEPMKFAAFHEVSLPNNEKNL